MKESIERPVKVRLLGAFWSVAGKGEEQVVAVPGTTVREVLVKLGEKYGDSFKELLWGSDGVLRPQCRIFLGSKDIPAEDLDKEVSGDEMYLFFMATLAGG